MCSGLTAPLRYRPTSTTCAHISLPRSAVARTLPVPLPYGPAPRGRFACGGKPGRDRSRDLSGISLKSLLSTIPPTSDLPPAERLKRLADSPKKTAEDPPPQGGEPRRGGRRPLGCEGGRFHPPTAWPLFKFVHVSPRRISVMWFLSQALEGRSPSRILEQIEGFLNNLPAACEPEPIRWQRCGRSRDPIPVRLVGDPDIEKSSQSPWVNFLLARRSG